MKAILKHSGFRFFLQFFLIEISILNTNVNGKAGSKPVLADAVFLQ